MPKIYLSRITWSNPYSHNIQTRLVNSFFIRLSRFYHTLIAVILRILIQRLSFVRVRQNRNKRYFKMLVHNNWRVYSTCITAYSLLILFLIYLIHKRSSDNQIFVEFIHIKKYRSSSRIKHGTDMILYL
jgi:hypothetical protein